MWFDFPFFGALARSPAHAQQINETQVPHELTLEHWTEMAFDGKRAGWHAGLEA